VVLEALLAAGNYWAAVIDRWWRGESTIEAAGALPVRATVAVTPR
jgi:hypothetical protein